MSTTRTLNHNPFLNRSAAFSKKFSLVDKMMNQLAEYLTFDEVDKLLKDMELRTKSKLEGNWTMGDCIDFFKQSLGSDRYDMLRNLWTLGNQQMIIDANSPESLKEIMIHKITMQEPASPAEYNKDPDSYFPIKVPM